MRAGSPSCSHAATEAKPTPPRHETASPPRHETGCFLIVHSVAKRHNIGTIARCATAFNVKEILLVGSNSFNSFGSFGATDYVKFR